MLPARHMESPQAGLGADSGGSFSALRRYTRRLPDTERCDLCGAAVGAEHAHLLDRLSRRISCSCDECAILFSGQQSAKFLRIPRRVLRLDCCALDQQAWDAMMLPINLAFFERTQDGRTNAVYPSPAGAMSSQLHLPLWNEIFPNHPLLHALEPDVEALLVNRIAQPGIDYVVPVDTCYRLIGLIRTNWRGLSGGPAVWQAVADYFHDLDSRAASQAGS